MIIASPRRGGFKRRGPKPPSLSFQGDRILKERGKFEIPLSLSGVLWLLSFDMKRQLTPQIFDLAGGSYAQLSSSRPAGAKPSLLPRSGVKKRGWCLRTPPPQRVFFKKPVFPPQKRRFLKKKCRLNLTAVAERLSTHRGISEEKLTDNTTSPRKDRQASRNHREP